MKKRIIFTLCLIFASMSAMAQNGKYQLSSHILDIDAGKPASDVVITLSKQTNDKSWVVVDEKKTDENGRVKDFLKEGSKDNTGIYKLTFHVAPYFEARGKESFYPFIEVVFQITDDTHYHVPITLSPFGYSTYRGN